MVNSIGHADRDREPRVPASEPGKPRGIVPKSNLSIDRLHLSPCVSVFKSEFQSRANESVQYRKVAT